MVRKVWIHARLPQSIGVYYVVWVNQIDLQCYSIKTIISHNGLLKLQHFHDLTFVISLYFLLPTDRQNPVIGPCPTAITLNLAQSQTSAEVTWTNPTGTDNSGATPIITSDQPQGSYTAGDYTVIVTATDPSGNEDTCTFSIRINREYWPLARPSHAATHATLTMLEGS